MHVFMIAAVTADGYIDRGKHQASTVWTSAEDKQFFRDRTKQAGVMITGSTTFGTIGRALPERKIYVLSSQPKPAQFTTLPDTAVEYTNLSPAALLQKLEGEGTKEVAICGGSRVYSQFMAAGLVQTIYLTLEPVVFGEGIKLFAQPIEAQLELQEVTQLSTQTLLLEYKVKDHA